MTPASAFSSLFRDARNASGATQRAMAARLGVSQALLSQWESGRNLPRPDKLKAIAAALGVDAGRLAAALRESRGETAPSAAPARALTVEALHAQARAHTSLYGPKRLEIWVIGGTNLSVMRRADLLEKRWKENLHWGVSYTMLWVLDLLDADRFGTVIGTLAELERAAARDHARWAGKAVAAGGPAAPDWLADVIAEGGGPGRVNHVAISVLEKPRRAALDLYARLAAGAAQPGAARGAVRPFAEGHTDPQSPIGRAARAILRAWHPESGVVVYRPTDGLAPAAANIRLMPVTEEIVTRLAPELEEPNYWYWLTPAGARRIVNAIGDLEAALDAG